MKRKFFSLTTLIIIIVGIFIYIDPNRSLRFTILSYGFSREAFTSEIVRVKQTRKNLTYNELNPSTRDKNNGPMILWETKRIGSFYFSKYFGSF